MRYWTLPAAIVILGVGMTACDRETRTVEIPLRAADLAYWDQERSRWHLEQGSVMVMAGGSSARAAIQKQLTVGR